ncbi:MAG: hypothetical protein HN868_18915 [Gammaproteobacteria bacterium]|nr:hypothetical protein [Gammaproteobacteria bacterium]
MKELVRKAGYEQSILHKSLSGTCTARLKLKQQMILGIGITLGLYMKKMTMIHNAPTIK